MATPACETALEGDIVHLAYLECIFERAIGYILGFAGLALFVMLIIGGFRFITAGDNPEKAAAARKTLTIAIMGFVIIVLAYLFLRTIGVITGVDLTEFKIFQGAPGVQPWGGGNQPWK